MRRAVSQTPATSLLPVPPLTQISSRDRRRWLRVRDASRVQENSAAIGALVESTQTWFLMQAASRSSRNGATLATVSTASSACLRTSQGKMSSHPDEFPGGHHPKPFGWDMLLALHPLIPSPS